MGPVGPAAPLSNVHGRPRNTTAAFVSTSAELGSGLMNFPDKPRGCLGRLPRNPVKAPVARARQAQGRAGVAGTMGAEVGEKRSRAAPTAPGTDADIPWVQLPRVERGVRCPSEASAEQRSRCATCQSPSAAASRRRGRPAAPGAPKGTDFPRVFTLSMTTISVSPTWRCAASAAASEPEMGEAEMGPWGPAEPLSNVHERLRNTMAAFVSTSAEFGTVVLQVETPEAVAGTPAPVEEVHRSCEPRAEPAVRGEYHGCSRPGEAKQCGDEGERHAGAAKAVQGARPEARGSLPWCQYTRVQSAIAARTETRFRRAT
jgi:hypothetical protein